MHATEQQILEGANAQDFLRCRAQSSAGHADQLADLRNMERSIGIVRQYRPEAIDDILMWVASTALRVVGFCRGDATTQDVESCLGSVLLGVGCISDRDRGRCLPFAIAFPIIGDLYVIVESMQIWQKAR